MNRLIAGEIVDITKIEAPYVYQEYPKWVTLADGSQIIVQNEDEERAAIGEEADSAEGGESLRDALMDQAKALGLNPHHRSGADKLRELIDQAKGQ